ncbi:MAG: hypothetical protein IJW16_05475 [Clostridia bacterium]|nr:hypothetical protein [Clostridia bacterium]
MLDVLEYKVLGNLPDLFTNDNGKKVVSREDWESRRAELYRTAVELQYGKLPPKPEFLEVEPLFVGSTWSTYRILSGKREMPVSFVMRVGRPASAPEGSFPVIVDGDGCFGYFTRSEFIEPPMKAGIGWALFDRTEIAPDNKNAGRSAAIYRAYPEYDFGAIGAWAWGYSRCLDALIKLELVDLSSVTFTGHSRGGKTAMLAGVCDERATIVNPVETCAGSCSCYRTQTTAIDARGRIKSSEMLSDLMRNFPFWMGQGMQEYVDHPEKLPFDSHFLKALVAPRTLFVAEALHDIWANPLGSWMTTMAAGEAYKLLDAEKELFWYYRDGGHDHAAEDIQMLLNLILHKKDGIPLSENFFRRPFKAPELLFDKH